MNRAPVVAEQAYHGATFGTSDEMAGMDALRADSMGMFGKGVNALMNLQPATQAADGLTGIFRGNELRENEAYDTALTEARENISENRENYPITSFVSEMAGGAYAPGAPLRSGATALNASRPIASTALRSGATGAGYGAVYGLGEGEEGERAQTAATGGVFSVLGGAGLGAAGAQIGKWINGTQQGRMLGEAIDMARNPSRIGGAARSDFLTLLTRSGVSRERVAPLLVKVNERIQGRSSPTLFARVLIEELDETNPQAAQQIGRAWRQLFLAPASEGDTGLQLSRAVDDQTRSQEGTLNHALDEAFGPQTVANDLEAINAERQLIGEQRDDLLSGIGGWKEDQSRWVANVGQNTGFPNRVASLMRDSRYADDREFHGFFHQAARELDFADAQTALQRDPANLLVKFQELIHKQSKTARGVSPFIESARQDAKGLLDQASRYGRAADSNAIAPKVEGPRGPFRERQLEFSQNYSAEEAIETARGQLTKLRDPLEADNFLSWYQGLPSGEQELVNTVLRNDLSKVMRGGRMTDDAPWMTYINRQSLADVLPRILGEEEGGRLVGAITDVLDDQRIVGGMLDPRHANGQPRTALGHREAQDARHLYTRSPLRHFDDIP
ncbi:MAG: hypothetical protein AAF141_13395, partial [Pseudomonadota bacterium]